jgi:serine/threonine protein kinase
VHGTVLYVLGGNNVLERVVFADCGLLPGDDAYSNGGGMIQVYFARLRLVSSAFRRNRMPRGGALHLGEDTAAEIVNCIFSENVAVISGGAISFDGMGTLDIASSTFVSNAVRTLAWASTVSVTVRLFPGLLFDVGSVPIWRIDDGPVHGLEYVQCESARQASVSGVQRGLPESWPNSAESCANISYNQLTGASAAVVSLEQGAHTLWVGSYALCPGFVLSWGGGGWIEIIDYMAPRFPKAQIVDNRNADRYPGCNTAANCELVLEDVEGLNQDINGVPPCPVGEAFWTSYSFDASTGTGGALALENYNRVSLRDTSFKDNSAGVGAAVYALAIASMQIVNTTFSEESSSAVKLIGVQISTCVDEPCKLGERCTIRAVSRFCDPCRSNEISDGVVCRACERGTEPSSDRSSCVACQGQHTYSAGGICQVCEGLASPDHRFCNDCPAHMAPRHTGGCECESSRYNILSGVITCHTHDHQADAFEGDGYQVAAELYRNGRAGGLASICVPCPVCVDCTTSNDPPRIRAGYALTPSTVANGDFEQYGKDTSVYKCRPEAIDGRLNDQRVAAMVDAGELVDDDLAQCLGTHNRTAVCANGHTGTLCGECVSGYGRRRSNRCQLCSEAVTWLKLLNAVLAMVALLAAMFGFMVILTMCIGAPGEGGVPKQDLEEDAQTFVNPLDESSTPPNDSEAQRSASGAQSVIVKSRRLFVVATRMATQPIKIFISYWQIASQLGPVLHFQFPPMLSNLMDSFRWIVTGIQGVVATECLPGVHGYYSTFVLELVGYPLILLAGVLSYYVYIKRQQGDTIAVATLKNQAFGITFLCYPFMCNQLFGMLNCRDLNEQTVLAKDYSISCSTDVHWWFAVLSKLLIAAFAFGVPIGVMVAMKRSSDQEADAFGSSEWAYTIQRMAAQLKEDDVDTVRAAVIDVQLGKIYGSFVTAYKPSCFWWEGIDMLRKLLIIGVLSVVSQGSTFQICVGLITGFFFFAGHLLKLPFRHFEDNVLKATSELHIYLMLVLVLALKSDVSSETFDSDSYDIAATAMFVLFVPVALIGSIVSKFRTIVRDEIDAGTQSSQLDQVRAAFQRYKFSRDKWEDREVLGRFIDSMQAADTAALQEAGLFHTPDKALCTHQRRGGDVHPGTHVCEGEYRATAGDQPVKCAVKIRALITTLQAESGIRLECSHKNVCSMLFAAEVGDSHYLAMQLCTQSLERALRERKLGGNRVGVCRGIVEGLNALHSALFVHGNVTPANVLLDQSGIPKLSGFSSCAKVRQGDGGAKLCAARCTAGFTPPEVFNALDSDGFVDLDSPLAVDAFGLGCTVFAVLSGGDAAFGGSSKAEVQTNVEAARSNVETNGKVCPEGVNLCSGLTNLDPASRPTVGSVVAHPLFWTRNAAVEYLAGIGGILPVGIKRSQHPFVADLEDAMDENIGEYNETAPEDGGSWAAQLELQKAVPDWGTQRKPADEERNYYIFGAPPKKKQIQARDRLIADGKPLGSHEAKQVRSVGLLKFLRNVHAHRFEAVEGGRFESENEILGYLLDGFPWLLITVHTLDGKHGYGRSADEADTSSDGGDSTQSFLRMSFAANTQSARSLAATEE